MVAPLLTLSLTLLTMASLGLSAKMINQEEIIKIKKEAQKLQEVREEEILEELQDAQFLKEWEIIVKNLDDDQLDNIEDILAQDFERKKEFDLIVDELRDMGMEEQDISDLKQLAELMHEFLIKVPNLKIKLEIASNDDLLDNIQLYLLGLPNKLGPLGYIALHHILDGESEGNGEIVDIIVDTDSLLDNYIEQPQDASYNDVLHDVPVDDIAPTFRRRRSPIEKVLNP